MTDKDLRNQLEGLFADTVFEPETETEEAELLLDETIVGLLEGESGTKPVAAGPATVEAPPPIPAKPEEAPQETKEKHGFPHTIPASVRLWEIALGNQGSRILSILLRGAIILGGVLLVFLLIRLIWQNSMLWSGFHVLYFAAYVVAIAITLIQWMFNSSLIRALREAKERNAEATHSQTLLEERAGELATANALLQKRTLQLQTAVLISQTAASVLDPDELVGQAVNLIRERFNLYYVGLFLIDESGQWAALKAGTGDAGRRMLEQGYRLEVGDTSTVGWCTANAQARTAPDLDGMRSNGRTKHSTEHSRGSLVEVNPLLPETRSEIALPLRSRGRVIGALDVQSAEREAFSQEDVAVLQAVADQVAVAIDNAQLFAEIQAKLEEIEARQKRDVREQWADFLSTQTVPSYERTRPGVTPLDDATVSEGAGELGRAVKQALARQEAVVQPDTSNGAGQATLVVPISLRNEVLGALGLHETEGGRRWTDDEIALIEAVADQMALAIENARLLEETRRRAERERTIAGITAQVRSSMDPETILQTAVRELGAALGTDRTFVRLGTGTQPPEE